MTAKEKNILKTWLNEIDAYESQKRELWKELGEMYVTRGGGDKPTCSILAHFDYLQTSCDSMTRNRAKVIWTHYHEASAQIDARMKLGQAFADV